MSVEEADLGMTQMAMGQSGDDQINPALYENLFVRFVMYPHQDQAKTKKEGRPIFNEIPYVDIRTPGDRTSHIFRPAHNLDKLKWPKHWAAFESNKEQGQDGMPLEHWPLMNRAMVEELKYFNIRTVEALAHMNDTSIQNFMGIRAWIQKAQAFLAVSKKSQAAEELAGELAKRDSQIMTLQQQVKDLMAGMAAQAEGTKAPHDMVHTENEATEEIPEPEPEPEPEPDADLEALTALAQEDEEEKI